MANISITPVGQGNWWDGDPVAAQPRAAASASPFAGAISSVESGGNYKFTTALNGSSAQAQNAPQSQPASQWWANDPVASDAPAQPQAAPFVPQQPDNRPDISRGRALGEGLRSGLTFNFGDELAGAVSAGQAGIDMPPDLRVSLIGQALSVPVGVARMIYEAMNGGGEATKAYEGTRNEIRGAQKAAQEQHPGTYMAGQVGGAIALPVGGALSAATLPGRMGRSAVVGAGYGGLSGVGEGQTAEDRATRGATGLAIGGTVGAVAPPLVEGVVKGVGAIAAPAVSAIRGLANLEAEAARRVVGSMSRDAQAGSANMGPAEFGAARAGGAPVALADMGGEVTRGLARSAANTSPEGRATLERLTNERFSGQADRASTFIRNLTGGATDTAAKREGLLQQARNVNRPAYAKAYSQPSAQGMWDEGFEQIAQAPVVQDAIRAASITGANRGTIEGFGRFQSPFIVDKASGQLTLRTDAAGNRVLPNLQFWDHVKRNLDKINTPEARTLNGALKSHLDDLVPDYPLARAGAAKFFDAEDALSAGENFVRQNKNIGEATRALGKMSTEERELFRQGFAARLIDDIDSTRDRVNVLNKIGATPLARQKLQMVLGPAGYKNVEAFLTVEHAMEKLRPAVTGNSTTARQLFELTAAGGVGGYGAVTSDPNAMLHAGLAWALLRGQRGIDSRVSRRVAEMLASDNPDVLAKGVKIVASNQKMLNGLRNVEGALARVGGGQSPTSGVLPALQIPSAGRAEDQPNVPRPPGQ